MKIDNKKISCEDVKCIEPTQDGYGSLAGFCVTVMYLRFHSRQFRDQLLRDDHRIIIPAVLEDGIPWTGLEMPVLSSLYSILPDVLYRHDTCLSQ
jgi:hypothetical protein